MAIKGQSPSQRLNSNTSLALGKNNGAILIQDEEGTLGGINPPQSGKSVLSFAGGLPNWKTLNELFEVPAPSASPAVFGTQNGEFVWIAPPAGPAGPQGPKGDKGDQGIQGAVGPQGPQGIGLTDLGGINGPATHWNGTYKWRHLGGWGPDDNAILVHRAFVADRAQTAYDAAGNLVVPGVIQSMLASEPQFQFHKPGVYGAVLKLDNTNWLSTQGWSSGAGFTSMRVGNLQVNGGLYFPDGSVMTAAKDAFGGWVAVPINAPSPGATYDPTIRHLRIRENKLFYHIQGLIQVTMPANHWFVMLANLQTVPGFSFGGIVAAPFNQDVTAFCFYQTDNLPYNKVASLGLSSGGLLVFKLAANEPSPKTYLINIDSLFNRI